MATVKASKAENEKREKLRAIDIKETDVTHDYYSIRSLTNTDGHILLAIGQRSNGKTWSSLDYVLDMYNRNGYRFTYVRRWAEDITAKTMIELFSKSDLKKYFGDEAIIKYRSSEFILYKTPDSEPEVIGFTAALNQVAHTKGRNFPNSRTIIFDEFLAMITERSLKGELDAWNQTISTIFRIEPSQDLMIDRKIIMLGNTVTKYSPYFKRYGIDVKKIKQGEITEVNLINPSNGKTTKVKLEYCKYNPRIGEETSVYVVGSKMAQTGEFEMEPVAAIPYTDGETYTEKMLMSMYEPEMETIVGVFLRKATWYTAENVYGIITPKAHHRSFLVIRYAMYPSSFYHLTTIKDLTYGSWNDLQKMLNDINENTEIDIRNELIHGRVFCTDEFVGESFIQAWKLYNGITIQQML